MIVKRARRRAALSRACQPALEGLEERLLLFAANGGEWTYGSRITYSFAPDGTDIGGYPSTLNQAMYNNGLSTFGWQQEFRKAAATWAAVTGIDIVEVPDNGARFSAPGDQQGDPNFGDIRIGGESLDMGKLACAFLPPPYNGGSLAGDIVINTAQPWGINANGKYDIESVALHEFGHALGLDHSGLVQADMYASYAYTKQTLNTDDIAGIQSVYGARPQDAFDTYARNDSYYYSDVLNGYIDGFSHIVLPNLDITYNTDYDWFYVNVPTNNNGTMNVTVQSTGLSSLSPRMYVYDSSLRLVGYAMAPSTSFGATITVTIPGVSAGQGYFLRAMASSAGPQGTGRYALLVNFGGVPISPIQPPNTTVLSQPDQDGGGSSGLSVSGGPGHAHQLWKHTGGASSEDVAMIGNLTASGDFLEANASLLGLPSTTYAVTMNDPSLIAFVPSGTSNNLPDFSKPTPAAWGNTGWISALDHTLDLWNGGHRHDS